MLLWFEFCAEFITWRLYPCQKCSRRVLKRYETNFIGEVIFAGVYAVFYENLLIGKEESVHRLRIRNRWTSGTKSSLISVTSGCPFSQAAFDCTCSVAYPWSFFFFLIFNFRLDHDEYDFSNWFHPPQINACHSNFISYVSMFYS